METFSGFFLGALLALAVLYDFYTSFYGARFVTIDLATGDQASGFSKWLVVMLLTILSIAATIICSWIFVGQHTEE